MIVPEYVDGSDPPDAALRPEGELTRHLAAMAAALDSAAYARAQQASPFFPTAHPEPLVELGPLLKRAVLEAFCASEVMRRERPELTVEHYLERHEVRNATQRNARSNKGIQPANNSTYPSRNSTVDARPARHPAAAAHAARGGRQQGAAARGVREVGRHAPLPLSARRSVARRRASRRCCARGGGARRRWGLLPRPALAAAGPGRATAPRGAEPQGRRLAPGWGAAPAV